MTCSFQKDSPEHHLKWVHTAGAAGWSSLEWELPSFLNPMWPSLSSWWKFLDRCRSLQQAEQSEDCWGPFVSLSLCSSASASLSASLCLSISVSLFILLSPLLCVSVSIPQTVSISLCPSVSVYLCLRISPLCLSPFVSSLSVPLCFSQSLSVSVSHLSPFPPFCPGHYVIELGAQQVPGRPKPSCCGIEDEGPQDNVWGPGNCGQDWR